MTPTAAERDQIFKTFGRAWFKQDLDLMFTVVTPDFTWTSPTDDGSVQAVGRDQVAAMFASRNGLTENVRFHDVTYHHAEDASFMTFSITGTVKATGEPFETAGVERYTFRDGQIAEKDVYLRQTSAK